MSKRIVNFAEAEEIFQRSKKAKIEEHKKKHTLDSDEEDSDDGQNVLDDNELEGEEEGVSRQDEEAKITPFNMKEEMEEGHFDKDGHYLFNKSKEIKDNWLDNIDWVKIKETGKSGSKKTDDDSSDDEEKEQFSMLDKYKQILELMVPKETIKQALQRLGKSSKISSAERWKRKKAGIVDTSSEQVNLLTECADSILTNTGNMNVYEETYEEIKGKLDKSLHSTSAGLDMYDDDFDAQEKEKVDTKADETPAAIMWEFKWKQEESEQVYGPYSTQQMQCWVQEGYFKDGVYVRKVGEDTKFYTSNRIDFELYL